jgi:glycosyltransferase involved in cell wall biosynthesis
MNIWLIMSGEPLEIFGERPHRVGILSKMLVEKGYQVTWFTTTFDHQHKKYLFNETTKIKSPFGVNMVFLHSNTPYYKNISFARLKNHKEVGEEFYRIAKNLDKPDIILSAFPTIDLAYNAVNYAKENNIPIVIDVRDLWPEIFLDVLPTGLKFFGKFLLKDYFNKAKYIFRNTDFITSMTEEFLEYGLKYAKRANKNNERSFPFGYPDVNLNKKKEKIILKNLNINFDKFTICYFGTIGKQFDFQPLIEVAKKQNDIQFIICGNGNEFESLKIKTKNLKNFILPGWVTQDEIWTIMKHSKVAIAPYIYKENFLKNLTNKPIEYLAGGLPILSSIDGVLGNILKDNQCGFVYDNSDDLYKYIIKLKDEHSLRKNMSNNAKKLFEERFSANKVYGEMIEYLENIVKNCKKD